MKALTIAPTNKCPLNCSHCGPSSGPNETGGIAIVKMSHFANYFAKNGFMILNITGGEPFLLGRQLSQLVALAKDLGYAVRITTSGYWAKTEASARSKLKELALSGLSEFHISLSDGHLSYLDLSAAVNVTKVSQEFGIRVILGIALERESKISPKAVIDYFHSQEVKPPLLHASAVIPFGRAAKHFELTRIILKDFEEFSGPCPSILNHPMLHPNGNVTPCASVFANDCKPLSSGNVNTESIEAIASRMRSHPLFAWIHNFGVVALKEMIEKNTSVRFQSKYGSICHLCGDILYNQVALAYLRSIKFLI